MEKTNSCHAVEALYFTDPLCSWSWALEPERKRLEAEFGEAIHWRTLMGGMISDWLSYSDPLNAVSRPAQMGPQWLHVKSLTGVEIDERIWVDDPPGSSYPACLAVKAAQLQGQVAGVEYLGRARQAVMRERRNIARTGVLLELAEELAAAGTVPFDAELFRADLDSDAVREAFREDLRETRYREVGRFPTLILHANRGRGILLAGYRPYEVLRSALLHVAPQLDASPAERLVESGTGTTAGEVF
jgi:predicted DsbA family dithiol-disulfide isomerase